MCYANIKVYIKIFWFVYSYLLVFRKYKMFNKLIDYLKEVKLELGKVNWLSRKETIRYTLVVIGVSLVVAVYLGGLDYVFSWLLNKFIL